MCNTNTKIKKRESSPKYKIFIVSNRRSLKIFVQNNRYTDEKQKNYRHILYLIYLYSIRCHSHKTEKRHTNFIKPMTVHLPHIKMKRHHTNPLKLVNERWVNLIKKNTYTFFFTSVHLCVLRCFFFFTIIREHFFFYPNYLSTWNSLFNPWQRAWTSI